MARVARVLGQPGVNIPPATMAAPATAISGRGPNRGTSCETSPEATTTPTAMQVGDARPDRAVAEDVLDEQGEEEEQAE